MTAPKVREILDQVSYKDWAFEIGQGGPGDFWLQVVFAAVDPETGGPQRQTGRKWRLSRFMTRSEIVQTALKAVLTAEEHEAREQFLYRGLAVFGPHIDVDALVAIAERKEVRQ